VPFVQSIGDESSPAYLPPSERIAVFDNDGTLWAEQPAYFQLFYAIDKARRRIEGEPARKSTSPFREVAANDFAALVAGGEESLLELVMATHAGQTEAAFAADVRDWLARARHPQLDVPYTELVYQPMLELLDFLRDNGFTPWIVSGGGQSFLRVWGEGVYGIPPENVIGSQVEIAYEPGPSPELRREPKITHVNDKGGKPVGIQRAIGRRPVLAVGNSDGDFAMLEWTTSAAGASLGVLLHHTDAEREWAYDRDTAVGHLERGLKHAPEAGWLLVDMARDWKRVFP